MSRNKKYYWMKLKEDFFEDDTIEWLEEQPNGKEYALFYLKLCLKSLKNDGVLIRKVGDMLIPYDAKKIAEITKTDIDTVVVAMELFKKINLVEILENGEIYMKAMENMVGSETDSAIRVRKHRALKEQEMLMLQCNTDETAGKQKCSPEKEKEKEKEKEGKTKRSFVPPSIEDVEAYCREKGYHTVNAVAFVAFYESKGWKVGKEKMSSWKSAVAGWEARNKPKEPAATPAAAPKTNDALERRRQMMGG